MSQAERNEAVNEIRLLASVNDGHIVGYHEAFVDGNRLCIVMEYAPYGDLSRAIKKRQTQHKPLSEDLIWSYLIQIMRGLQALHAARILHRDVKTANVLRMSGETVKLGDLGVAKLLKNNMTNTQIGTPHYMPPEVWKNRPYSFSSDVWALGCVLYEMCTFSVPFEARTMEELRYKVMRGRYQPIPSCYSSELHQMIAVLLQIEPQNRPTIKALLESPSILRRMNLVPDPEPPSTAASQAPSGILDTIKVPKNLRLLRKRLPAPQYPEAEGAQDTAVSWPRPQDNTRLPPITASSVVSSPGRMQAVPEAPAGRKPSEFNRPLPKLPKIKDPAVEKLAHQMPERLQQQMPRPQRPSGAKAAGARNIRASLDAVKEVEENPLPPVQEAAGMRMQRKRVIAQPPPYANYNKRPVHRYY